MLAIQLSGEVERRLDAVARMTGQPAGLHVERAIVEYLGDLEDYAAAEREVEEVRAGRSATPPLPELLKAHDAAD